MPGFDPTPDPAAAPAPAEPGLGARLRDRRKEMGLTLKDVARRAGLSVGFISQIERGIASPSLSSLAAVARVLGADPGEFFTQPPAPKRHTRKAERPVYGFEPGSLSYERISSSFPGNTLRSVIMHEPPGHRSPPISHDGEELFFVLQGAITVEIEGDRTVLEAGDSIHFDSRRTHSTWNHTDASVAILHTCTLDVFGDGGHAAADDGANHGADDGADADAAAARTQEKEDQTDPTGRRQ